MRTSSWTSNKQTNKQTIKREEDAILGTDITETSRLTFDIFEALSPVASEWRDTFALNRERMKRIVYFRAGAFVVCSLVLFVCLCFAAQRNHPGVAQDAGPGTAKRKLLTVPVGPLGVITNAIIQPTTFLRVALLILRNQIGANPTEEFLQMILSTDIGYTKFTNVFASFATGAIQDFSSGVTTDTVLAQEWVIDGFSTLDNTVFSEFFAGGASSRAEIDGRERRADVERVD